MIIEQNFSTGMGEVDIIAAAGKTLVFLEVKTRTSDYFGSPSESIDANKASKIRKAASCYLAKMDPAESCNCRFDVIAIMVSKNNISKILREIDHDVISNSDIPAVAAELIDSCTIDHIEAAF